LGPGINTGMGFSLVVYYTVFRVTMLLGAIAVTGNINAPYLIVSHLPLHCFFLNSFNLIETAFTENALNPLQAQNLLSVI
jgi:hypothetical protein